MSTKHLGPNDAAEYLGISRQTLYNWRNAGHGPAFTLLGNRARYSIEDLDDYLARQRVEPEKAGVK